MGLIVFLGDSITDAGRKESSNQLGFGYVNIFSETLRIRTEIESYDVHHRVTQSFEFTTDYTD